MRKVVSVITVLAFLFQTPVSAQTAPAPSPKALLPWSTIFHEGAKFLKKNPRAAIIAGEEAGGFAAKHPWIAATLVPAAIATASVFAAAQAKKGDSNRGRIQIQGGGVEISSAWAQSNVISGQEGLQRLNSLVESLSLKEAVLRSKAIEQARSYISRCSQNGGCSPPGQGFPVLGDRQGRRVDIEIRSGTAFN